MQLNKWSCLLRYTVSLATLSISFVGLMGVAVAAAGELDPSFATAVGSPYRPAGVLRNLPAISAVNGTISSAHVAVRADRGFYVAVPCLTAAASPAPAICVTSYTESGATEIGFGVVSFTANASIAPQAIAVDQNDNVWIVGICDGQSCIQKVLRSGAVANNLGASGNQSRVQAPSMIAAGAIDVGYDGKLAVGGRCFNGSRNYPCAIRLLANGVPDPAFAGGFANGWGNDSFALIELLNDGQVRKIKLLPDGRIYAAGRCTLASGERMCLAIIEANGTRQNYAVPNSQDGFDILSYYIAFPPGSMVTFFSDFAVQTDGLALLYGTCGYVGTPNGSPCLSRIQPGVGADVYFANAGHVRPYLRPEPMQAAGMVLRQDGSIVTLANCDVTVGLGTRRQLCVTALGSGGNFSLQFFAGSNAASDIEFDPGNTPSRLFWDGQGAVRYFDQSLLAVASCPDTGGFRWFCLARISLSPPAAPNCKPDLDGDRRAQATTDAALIARIARGGTSDAALANVIGSGATRSTWATLRDHLNAQCGMSLAP